MQVAFIEDAQQQVDQQQGAQQHQWLALLGLLELLATAAQAALDFSRQADGRHGPVDGAHRLVEAHAFGQVEVDVFHGKLAVMGDPVVGQAALEAGKRRQRHTPAIAGDQVDLLEYLRRLRVTRVDLEHHLVLVEAGIDGGNLPLAEGVVEQGADFVHLQAEAACRHPVDDQAHLLRAAAVIGVDGGEFRQAAQRLGHTAPPLAQQLQVAGQQLVLVLRAAALAATEEHQVLVRHQHQPPTRYQR